MHQKRLRICSSQLPYLHGSRISQPPTLTKIESMSTLSEKKKSQPLKRWNIIPWKSLMKMKDSINQRSSGASWRNLLIKPATP